MAVQKTEWKYKATYIDGYIRAGINNKPEKGRPEDFIRLKIKSKNGTGDCDLQVTSFEAADICAGLNIVIASIMAKK